MAIALDSGRGKKTLRPTINVTPLVDVVLVLLIIFMVVIPNMQEDKPIELFKTKHAQEDTDEDKQALVVTLTQDGGLYMENAPYEREALLGVLREAHGAEPDRRIMVRADTRLPYGDVRSFFYSVKELGFDRVNLAVGAVQEGDLAGGMMGDRSGG